jgi:hypothetical protein
MKNDIQGSKTKRKKYTSIQFVIENSLAVAIGLCFLGIIASVLLQVFYVPSWKKDIINDVKEQLEPNIREIKEHLESKSVDDLLILYGGGTVQYYLQSKGVNVFKNNRIIIPAPSGVARASLKDDVFLGHLRDKVIIMSSKKAEDKDFSTNSNSVPDYNVLEIFLAIDTLYVRTTNKFIKEKYKDKILVSELKQLLTEIHKGKLSLDVCATSINSGTRDSYSALTNHIIDSISTKEYTINSDYIGNDTAIILTRTYYDPLPTGRYTPIYILEDGNNKAYTSEVYLYIPVSLDKNNRIIIPPHTLEFLQEVKPKKRYTDIIGKKDGSLIIRDDVR